MSYSYERIINLGSHSFRIRDGNDNRVATCYDEENAKFIVGALNRLSPISAKGPASPSAIKYRMTLKFDGGEERVVEGEYEPPSKT